MIAATGRQPRVIFDLSEARYLDSSALSFLIRRWKTLGDRMAVVVPAVSPVRRVFTITQLDRYLPLVETSPDAYVRA